MAQAQAGLHTQLSCVQVLQIMIYNGRVVSGLCVLGIIFNMIRVDCITGVGSTCKQFKDIAVIFFLQERANCMQTHLDKPWLWNFRFMEIVFPCSFPNIPNTPFWGPCVGCNFCEDVHFRNIEGEEGVCRNAVGSSAIPDKCNNAGVSQAHADNVR